MRCTDQFNASITAQFPKHGPGQFLSFDVFGFDLNRLTIVVANPDATGGIVEERDLRRIIPIARVAGQVTLFQMIIIEYPMFLLAPLPTRIEKIRCVPFVTYVKRSSSTS